MMSLKFTVFLTQDEPEIRLLLKRTPNPSIIYVYDRNYERLGCLHAGWAKTAALYANIWVIGISSADTPLRSNGFTLNI
ncbi:MAG: hypothetical protein COT17_05530, partial [Elusimicrobia bacterium CG08_land_8_20_14_0_20_51_18]